MDRNREGSALSVVLACADSRSRGGSRCIAALERELATTGGELLIVSSPEARRGAQVSANGPDTREIRSDGVLVPQLWGDGARAARGRAVAFLIPECEVRPGWARALLAELDAGAAGAGGQFALHGDATSTDVAVFVLRYAAFVADGSERRDVAEIAGDNAMYRRDVLVRHAASIADGFWEIDLHRRLRAEGERLVLTGGAVAEFTSAPPLFAMARQRLTHGRHFGAWRRSTGGRSAFATVLFAPAIPFLLVARNVRRLPSRARSEMRLLPAIPALFVLACAWALGEALGAIAGAGTASTGAA